MIEEFEIARLALHPDDVLVVRCKCHITAAMAQNIRDAFARILPGQKVMVLTPDLHLEVLCERPDDAHPGECVGGFLPDVEADA